MPLFMLAFEEELEDDAPEWGVELEPADMAAIDDLLTQIADAVAEAAADYTEAPEWYMGA